MYLIATDFNGIGIFIGVVSLLVGILSWWLSKLLSDKRDSTIHEVKIEQLERRMQIAENEIRDLQQRD